MLHEIERLIDLCKQQIETNKAARDHDKRMVADFANRDDFRSAIRHAVFALNEECRQETAALLLAELRQLRQRLASQQSASDT
jgi:hypothetical protein